MDEISDEQNSNQEYQDLIKAIRTGAERIDNQPGNMLSVFHIGVLNGIKTLLDSPEHLFSVYHRTAKPPADHKGEKVVWDLEVEYNGELVMLRKLIEQLELLWYEYRMFSEGGV